ncbi:hypothetical protein PENSUB_12326 [Penicillium subrubescens]|uniref:Uncharacterized protein n=1 Tax=Penicillium subrubescens TaxID=1316194 RepID=A0A1Q5SZ71_9EURO|nr:hypothetical protein PENSUB_12326 [Penicillium subrubescens]
MSTTPRTPTKSFAHPLAQVKLNDAVNKETQNYLSHILFEECVWHEIYYVVDYFRRTTLGPSQIPLENNVGFITDARCPSHISHVFGFDSTARRLEQ